MDQITNRYVGCERGGIGGCKDKFIEIDKQRHRQIASQPDTLTDIDRWMDGWIDRLTDIDRQVDR